MAIYTIKDLEKLCGIKAHTIRIWEQRYGLIVPSRTQTNIRFYQEDDLKDLLYITTLNKNGFKISAIAQMSKSEIHQKANELSALNLESDAQLNTLTMAMIEMDEEKLDYILSKNIKDIGFERTMLELIFPFLEKLGVLWLTGSINPVQENFVSCLIRQKMLSAIDRISLKKCNYNNIFVLFLPEGEDQELSLMFMHYLVKSRGFKVFYLGLNTSLVDLQDAMAICRPSYLFTMISESFTRQPVQKYIDQLASTSDQSQVLLSGYQVVTQSIKCPPNVKILTGLQKTIDLLNGIK